MVRATKSQLLQSVVFLSIVCAVLLPRAASAQPAGELSFDGHPCMVTGAEGETVVFETFVALTMIAGDDGYGANGWTLSLTADGGKIEAITVDGIRVPTNMGSFDLAGANLKIAELAVHKDDPLRTGAVSAIVMTFTKPRTTPETGKVYVARILVSAEVPPAGECRPVTLEFENGFQGGGTPVSNTLSVNGRTVYPTMHSSVVQVCCPPATVTCDTPWLRVDEPAEVFLTGTAPGRDYRFAGEEGKSAIFSLSDPIESHSNALYARWGAPASSSAFDFAADRSRPLQRLVVPIDRAATLYVRAQSAVLDDLHQVILVAQVSPLAIEEVSATTASGSGDGLVEMVVIGSGFVTETVFSLEPSVGGPSTPASERVLVSSRRAEVAFDIDTLEPGVYDLKAESGGVVARLDGAFTIVEDVAGPLLEARLEGERHYRYNRVARLTLRFSNVGDGVMPAPLFKVAAPEESELRLDREDDFQGHEILVLGTHAGGLPGELPPGASVDVPILIQSTHCLDCVLPIRLQVLTTSGEDPVGWAHVDPPGGMTQEDWNAAWPALSVSLGATWDEVREALASIATRLSRRGVYSPSVRELFRWAVRDALGRPSAAIVGRVVAAADGMPLDAVEVAALEADVVQGKTVTDSEGSFALDCLRNGASYRLLVRSHDVGDVVVVVPGEGDVLGAELEATPSAEEPPFVDPPPDDAGLPARPLFPPPELFGDLSVLNLQVFSSWDPNEKEGCPDGGDIDVRKIRTSDALNYTIHFENLPTALGSAQVVVVDDVLDPDLDLSTLTLRSVQIGGDSEEKLVCLDNIGSDLTSGKSRFSVVSGSQRFSFSTTEKSLPVVVVTPSGETFHDTVDVQIDVELREVDSERKALRWTMTTLTDDLFVGFLPPNDETKRGEGFVSFSVEPGKDLAEGTELSNSADITFDELTTIPTDPVVHEISFFLEPGVPELPVPPDGGEKAVGTEPALSWSAERADTFDVYLWEGGEGDTRPAEPVAKSITHRTFRPGVLKHETPYLWQIVASNENGSTDGPLWEFETLSVPEDPPEAPADPRPPTGERNVSRRPLLGWGGGVGALTHEIYLWAAGDGRPAEPIVRGLTEKEFLPTEDLEGDTEYHWVAAALNGVGRTEGPEWTFTTAPNQGVWFKRGDIDGNGEPELTDAVYLLGYLYQGTETPTCMKSGDLDDDGAADLTDAVILLQYLYAGGEKPADPFDDCGPDPKDDELTCESFRQCG